MKSRKRHLLWLLLVFPVIYLASCGSQCNAASGGNPILGLSKISNVMQLVLELYVEPADLDELVDGAITGMLSALDPHSTYLPKEELREVTEDVRGEFEGIGVYFVIREKVLTVVSAIPGTPSDRLGISSGDEIVEINGVNTWGITNSEVQRKLKGPRGTTVDIKVRRPGMSELLDFTITRERIPIFSVESAFLIGDDVGYVRLNRFMQTSEQEVASAIRRLQAEGMQKLIFDLRGNTGGLLDQAQRISDLFLEGGQVVVSTEGRLREFNEVFRSTDRTTLDDFPLIVMINQGSASASEIVSGAIQDHDRGLIVGSTSFGKGLVQRQFDMKDSSAVRVTIAHYFTPSHRLIQRPYDKGLVNYYVEGYDDVDPNLIEDSTAVRPVYHTDAGRVVYGGGGITPDVRIRSGRLSAYTSRLRTKRAFFDFANHYAATGGFHDMLQRMNFDDFLLHWQPDEQVLRDFRVHADEVVEFVEEGWRTDRRWIQGYLKREFARVVWGRENALRVDVAIDPSVEEARRLFPEAIRVQNLN